MQYITQVVTVRFFGDLEWALTALILVVTLYVTLKLFILWRSSSFSIRRALKLFISWRGLWRGPRR